MEKNNDIVRSSVSEYLTYITATGESNVDVIYEDETLWLTQKAMSILYNVELNTINYHIKHIYQDKELDENSTIRKFRIVQNEGTRKITREVMHYNLQMVIEVGFKTNSERAVQFRKWANNIVNEFTIKGYSLDDERLKNNGSILTQKYFDELLERIREIRISERKIYQKITDIYATSIDYDKDSKITYDFFKKVQNKMHYAITHKTAPDGKIMQSDVVIAKNYLTEDELKSLERIVSAFLDVAEDMAERHIPMTMEDWANRIDKYLLAVDRDALKDAGKITHKIAKDKALSEFEKYRVIQDKKFKSDFDKFILDAENSTK